jgi:hypothetical protein
MCAVQPSSEPTVRKTKQRIRDLVFVNDSRQSVTTEIIFLTLGIEESKLSGSVL